jgi:hypothetical protein
MNPELVTLLFGFTKIMISLFLLETGMMIFTFGFVTMFFVSQYEWDRLRRDFELYWPQMVRDHYGPQGRMVFAVTNIIVIVSVIFLTNDLW